MASDVMRCGVCGRAAGKGHEANCSYGHPELFGPEASDERAVSVQRNGSLGLGKRRLAPTQTLKHGELCWRVWANLPSYDEEPMPWRCVGAFCFLTECLEYIAGCQDRGIDVVYQSPADCRLVKHTDRRMVCKPA